MGRHLVENHLCCPSWTAPRAGPGPGYHRWHHWPLTCLPRGCLGWEWDIFWCLLLAPLVQVESLPCRCSFSMSEVGFSLACVGPGEMEWNLSRMEKICIVKYIHIWTKPLTLGCLLFAYLCNTRILSSCLLFSTTQEHGNYFQFTHKKMQVQWGKATCSMSCGW